MKKVLAVVFAAAFLCVALTGAQAQIPYAQVYFDNTFQQTSSPCVGGLQQLFVVYHNVDAFMSSTQFSVVLPPNLGYAGESTTAGVVIGNAIVGAKYGWPIPINGYAGPILVTTIFATWLCADCTGAPPGGYPLIVTDYAAGAGNELKLGTFPDAEFEIYLVGMTSLTCPGVVPTQTQTWGAIKSLYSE